MIANQISTLAYLAIASMASTMALLLAASIYVNVVLGRACLRTACTLERVRLGLPANVVPTGAHWMMQFSA